jgi:hypothetical protein
MKRLEDKGRGILLLHDIQARTVAALPRILLELKARGYRIVHVVPATPELPATPTEPQQWQLHPPSETVAISHWPKIPNYVFADTATLPAPALSDAGWQDGQLAASLAHAERRGHGVPLPQEAPWPWQSERPLENAAITLPVPAQDIFEIPEKSFATIAGPSPHRAEQIASTETKGPTRLRSADEGGSPRTSRGRRHAGRELGRSRQRSAAHIARRGTRQAAHARGGALKHVVQVKKRSV